MSEDRWNNPWLFFGLAFVGGYGDAAGFILANSFTGHLTGAFVLAAISMAGRDWPTFFLRFSAIVVFIGGVFLSVALGRFVAKRLSWPLLPTVMALEIVLIAAAYFSMTSPLALRGELFIACLSLALGLQNGAVRHAGGVSVHTTYITGMITDLLTTKAERQDSPTIPILDVHLPSKGRLLSGIWLSFLLGALIGAVLVFRFQALGIFGAALILIALIIRLEFIE